MVGSLAVLVAVGASRYKGLRPELKILFWSFALELAIDLFTLYLALNKINNLLFYHIERVLQYLLVTFVLSYWARSRRDRNIFIGSIVGFVLFWTLAKIFVENTKAYDNYTSSLSSIFLVIFSCYLLVVLTREGLPTLPSDYRFWVVVGVILYNATNLILSAAGNVLLNLPFEKVKMLWSLEWAVTIGVNIIYMKAFFCKQTR